MYASLRVWLTLNSCELVSYCWCWAVGYITLISKSKSLSSPSIFSRLGLFRIQCMLSWLHCICKNGKRKKKEQRKLNNKYKNYGSKNLCKTKNKFVNSATCKTKNKFVKSATCTVQWIQDNSPSNIPSSRRVQPTCYSTGRDRPCWTEGELSCLMCGSEGLRLRWEWMIYKKIL